MADSKKLHKSIQALDVKVLEGEEGIATAIVSVFGVVDSVNDIIHPGAFTKTIVERGRRLRVLDMHSVGSVSDVVGKIERISEVGREDLPPAILSRYPEATGGLSVTIKFALNTPRGRTAFDLLSGEYINEFSIGFEILDSDNSIIERDGRRVRIRNIRTVRLWEVSPVIWGANPATDVVEVRAEAEDAGGTPPLKAQAEDVKGFDDDDGSTCIGDKLHAELAKKTTNYLASVYASGVIDDSVFEILMSHCMSHLGAMRSSMPEEFAMITHPDDSGWSYLAVDEDLEQKAGRVLSSSNHNKIKQANELLSQVLESADLSDDKEGKSKDTAAIVEDLMAGPSTEELTPTMESRAKAASLRILLLKQRFELLTTIKNAGEDQNA